jgi:ABC-type transporter Mla MlaB component
MGPELELTIADCGDVCFISFGGDLTLDTLRLAAPNLEAAIAGFPTVIVELAGLSSCHPAAGGSLVELQRAAGRRGCRLELLGGSS